MADHKGDIINMKNKIDESISSLLTDNQLIKNAKQISNHFNNFFTSKAKKTHLSYFSHENNNTIFLSPTVPKDIEDLIIFHENEHSNWSK